MKNGLAAALNRFDRFLNQLPTGLAQHLNRHIRRNQIFLYDQSDKIKICLGGSRKPHLDLFESQLQQQVIDFELFVGRHGLDQRLIAVAQINTAPTRRLSDHLVRPGPVGKLNGLERFVFVERHSPFVCCLYYRFVSRISFCIHVSAHLYIVNC